MVTTNWPLQEINWEPLLKGTLLRFLWKLSAHLSWQGDKKLWTPTGNLINLAHNDDLLIVTPEAAHHDIDFGFTPEFDSHTEAGDLSLFTVNLFAVSQSVIVSQNKLIVTGRQYPWVMRPKICIRFVHDVFIHVHVLKKKITGKCTDSGESSISISFIQASI